MTISSYHRLYRPAEMDMRSKVLKFREYAIRQNKSPPINLSADIQPPFHCRAQQSLGDSRHRFITASAHARISNHRCAAFTSQNIFSQLVADRERNSDDAAGLLS